MNTNLHSENVYETPMKLTSNLCNTPNYQFQHTSSRSLHTVLFSLTKEKALIRPVIFLWLALMRPGQVSGIQSGELDTNFHRIP